MNKTIEVIKSRVSCRAYSSKRVPKGKLEQILEAGKMAPSGMNKQISNILVIKNRRTLDSVRNALKEKFGRECLYGANTLCVVYGKREEPFMVQDCSCIIENMMIAATALKIDSCWINQLEDLLSDPKYKKLRKRLDISEDKKVVGSLILGYRLEGQEIPSKKRKDDFIRII